MSPSIPLRSLIYGALTLLCLYGLVNCKPQVRRKTKVLGNSSIPDQAFGYVDVREGAHMFWWFYGSTNSALSRDNLPIVLWLQGGPGAGGSGYGNFGEIGPINEWLNPRNYSWTDKVNLLFIDNPVGAGYSYVDSEDLLTTDVNGIAIDLLTIHETLCDEYDWFKQLPYWIFSESYGGKMTAYFGEQLVKAIDNGTISMNFQGVMLGDSWIQGVSYVDTWPQYLNALTLVDQAQYSTLTTTATKCENAVNTGNWYDSTTIWGEMEGQVDNFTSNVDFYNVLRFDINFTELVDTSKLSKKPGVDLEHSYHFQRLKYHHLTKIGLYLSNRKNKPTIGNANNHNSDSDNDNDKVGGQLNEDQIAKIMNDQIKTELGIIPENVTWGGQSGAVFSAQNTDFNKPVITSVDYLLANDIIVNIWNGQLDLICCTLGTLQWMTQLSWSGYTDFITQTKTAVYTPSETDVAYFKQEYENLRFYYMMKAGHMVPADNGYAAIMAMCDMTGVSCS